MNNETLELINQINNLYFKPNNLIIKNIKEESEGQEYTATKFELNQKQIIFRTGKITQAKPGFFVTCWKRNKNQITVPFDTSDNFDYLIIHTKNKQIEGLFIFSKQNLLENKIITNTKIGINKGKNGFRLYTPNLKGLNKQATKSQTWQTKYFIQIEDKEKIIEIITPKPKYL
jgi:hypothetical protein